MTHRLSLFLGFLAATTAHATIELIHRTAADDALAPFLALKGAYEHVSGDTKQASTTYAQLASLAPSNRHLTQARIALAFDRAEYTQVIREANHIDVTNPAHKKNAQRLAQSYLFTNQLPMARDAFAALQKQYPHDDSFDYYAAVTAIKMNDFATAQNTTSRVLSQETRENKHFLFHFLNAKMAFLSSDYDRALAHTTKSLAGHPRFAKGIMLKAAIEEKQKHPHKALATYEKYLAMLPDPAVVNRIVSLCFETKEYKKAYNLLLSQQRTAIDHNHDLAVLAMKQGDTSAAHIHIDAALAKDPTFSKGHKLKLHLLCEEQQFDQVCKLLKTWLHAQPFNQALITRAFFLQNKNVPRRILIDAFKHAAKQRPTIPLCFALADLLHQEELFEAARSWYEVVLRDKRLAPRSLLASKVHTQIARTLFLQKQFDRAHVVLTQARDCIPVYPSAYNLSALVLLETDGSREHARNFAQRALKAAPEHEPYLETLQRI